MTESQATELIAAVASLQATLHNVGVMSMVIMCSTTMSLGVELLVRILYAMRCKEVI